MTYPLPASLQRIHALGQDIAAARANPDIAPDDDFDPGKLRLPEGGCIPCRSPGNWTTRCVCQEPCGAARCSATPGSDLYAYNALPLPRWLACACCHAPSRTALIPLGPHHVCACCWDLIGTPGCPRAWREPSTYSSTPTPGTEITS